MGFTRVKPMLGSASQVPYSNKARPLRLYPTQKDLLRSFQCNRRACYPAYSFVCCFRGISKHDMPTQVDVLFFKKLSIFWVFPMICVPVRYQGKKLEWGFMLTTAPSLHPQPMGFSVHIHSYANWEFQLFNPKIQFSLCRIFCACFRITFSGELTYPAHKTQIG